MAASPNGEAIQVLERMKALRSTPGSFCRLGTICMALAPLPMTPTCLLVKSKLRRAERESKCYGLVQFLCPVGETDNSPLIPVVIVHIRPFGRGRAGGGGPGRGGQ